MVAAETSAGGRPSARSADYGRATGRPDHGVRRGTAHDRPRLHPLPGAAVDQPFAKHGATVIAEKLAQCLGGASGDRGTCGRQSLESRAEVRAQTGGMVLSRQQKALIDVVRKLPNGMGRLDLILGLLSFRRLTTRGRRTIRDMAVLAVCCDGGTVLPCGGSAAYPSVASLPVLLLRLWSSLLEKRVQQER